MSELVDLVSVLPNQLASLYFFFGFILPILLFISYHNNINDKKKGLGVEGLNSSVCDVSVLV